MPYPSPRLADAIARRHGIVTSVELIHDGFSRHAIRRLTTAGPLHRIHNGVFRVATAPDTFESRCVAACRADAEAVVTGTSAGRLWGFRHVTSPDEPIVLVRHDRTPLTRGVVIRRTNELTPEDLVERRDGIRVASPPRAWFDCARDLTDERFEMLTEHVLDRYARVPTLWKMARRLTARGRPGLARVRRVMSQRADWQRPAGSGVEHRVLRALEERGVGPLVRQYPLRLPNGIVIHPDGAVPQQRWAVEIDHVTWHGGRFEAQRDKGRDRNARRIGWQVDRVTDQELAADFDGAVGELVELYHLRRRDLAA